MTGSREAEPPGHVPADAGPRPPLTAGLVTFLSTVNIATLFSLVAGLCYFYDRAYRLAYFKPFGLDPEVIPITVQDAIADGFIGMNIHVLWLLVVVAVVALAYVVISWFGARWIDRGLRRLAIDPGPPAPHPAIVELERNAGSRTSLVACVVAIGTALFSIVALFLIGIPGDRAGAAEAARLRASVGGGARMCADYRLKGGAAIVGQAIGSTAERQFVLSVDRSVRVVRFDDLDSLAQEPVACVAPGAR